MDDRRLLAGAIALTCFACASEGGTAQSGYELAATAVKGMCRGRPVVVDPPRPLPATVSPAVACAATDTPLRPDARATMLATITGRWLACPESTARPLGVAIDGIEFNVNGRFQLLRRDGAGIVAPDPVAGSGRTVVFAGSPWQVGLDFERPTTGGINFWPEFSPEKATLAGPFNIVGERIKMARIEAGPADANPPRPLEPGRCSPFGVWDTVETQDGTSATFLFGDDGRFIAGAQDADVCATTTMYGAFGLTPESLEITEAIGMTPCDQAFSTTYITTFSDDCNTLSLSGRFDACTGGRKTLGSAARLRRRI